ncbi:MAG: hypothetical protein ABI239_09515, partial [Aquihabitans sp.]
MASVSLKKRVIWPVVGAVTAAATVVGTWAPVSQASPSAGTRDAAQKAKAADPGDGTYESCDAYFGLGKSQSVMDIVSFDVSDQNGADGIDHAVETDTEVIFVLTNEEGDTLECAPSEITEAEWDDFIDDAKRDVLDETALPSFPGPGHYAYPSTTFEPFLETFGDVIDVGFFVTSIPGDHTLVSPTEITPLVQHYRFPFGEVVTGDARVLDYVEAEAGTAARDALDLVFTDFSSCDDDGPSAALVDAMVALRAFHGVSIDDFPDDDCFTAYYLHDVASFVMALNETVTYVEPIVLEVPEVPTEITFPEPTTPETTVPTDQGPAQVPASPGATPVAAAPAY